MVYCNCRQIDEDGIVLRDNYFKYKNVPLVKGMTNWQYQDVLGLDVLNTTKSVKEKMIPFNLK